MNKRYMTLIPDYAHRAFEAWYAYGANDEKIEEFAGKWGGFSFEHFLCALEQGNGDDRLCAMFALGESLHPNVSDVLLPFLHSVRRDERCISALVLGMRRDTRAYPFLEHQLLEGLSLKERMDAFAQDHQEVLQDLFLCDRFRPKVVELLETWHSPTVIQTMIQALEALWALEKTASQFAVEGRAYDTLCYALGQRGVLTALDTLAFPPTYQKIAIVYLALGALHIHSDPTFIRSTLKSEARVKKFLEETFRIKTEEAPHYLETFYQENEVRQAHRAGLDEQAIEERLAEHFMLPLDYAHFFEDSEEMVQKEEHIAQREPVGACVYRGHTSEVWSLSWSPDGQHIVSGSVDTTAQVWNWHTGKQTALFREHQSCVTAVAWSPDGKWIASGGCDNTVFVWNAQTGTVVTAYTKQKAWICHGLAWSPDGVSIASASWDGTVHVWKAMTGETCVSYHGHQGVVTTLAWSPDGMQIASGGGYPECAIHVWNATTGQCHFLYQAHMQDRAGTRPVFPEVLKREEEWARGPDSLRDVVWSPDGKWIASVGLRNVFRIWNARTGEDVIALAQNRTNGPLAWSADSRYLATGMQNGVDLWSISQKRIMFNATPLNQYTVTTLGWSPDRKILAVGGKHPFIWVWSVDPGESETDRGSA